MALHQPIATHRAGARQLRSYSGDLGAWAGDIMRRYTTAVILAVIGALFVLVAVGFGVAALFHFLELNYGLNVAFASVGGFFIIIGLIVLLWGIALLKRALPPVPRPFRQLQEFKRAAALDLILRRDQVQSMARRHSGTLGMTGAGALALGFVVLYGLSRIRRYRTGNGTTLPD